MYQIEGEIYGEYFKFYSYETKKLLAFNLFLDFHCISKMYKEDRKVFLSGNTDKKLQYSYIITILNSF